MKALKIRQMIYFNDHPKVARSLCNISISYYILKDYNTSLEYAFQALKIR